MKRTYYIAAICLLMVLVGAEQALADCYLNGRPVPEGTRTGPLVCENGQWVERN
jgi:hypothetical protein